MNPSGSTAGTLVEVLRGHAESRGTERALSFISSHGAHPRELDYAALDQAARRAAWSLLELTAAGTLALLPVEDELDFVVMFLGCLYAGIIPIPTARLTASAASGRRLLAIMNSAHIDLLLCREESGERIVRYLAETGHTTPLVRLTPSAALPDPPAHWRPPLPAADAVAFLQYTSGSTSDPRGVMVTHANIMFNMRAIRTALQHDEKSVIVNWMPLHHDGGLIFMLLQALYCGAHCVQIPSSSFMGNPLRWLHLIARYQATTSFAPPFGYDLCVQRDNSGKRAGPDLRSWKAAVIGAEPIRHSVLEAFEARYFGTGLRHEAFTPGYGLAEATVMVSLSKVDSPASVLAFDPEQLEQGRVLPVSFREKGARNLVGCGQIVEGLSVVIVDPLTCTECPAGRVGEIWLAGAGVAAGYWNNPKATELTFRACLADNGCGPFLRSGDLGFMHNDELFVTGRLKELLIVAGENHYPQDIEATALGCHPALRPSGCAVFQTSDQEGGRVVVLLEIRSEYRQELNATAVIQAVRKAIVDSHGIALDTMALLPPKALPKTTSGKLQRQACHDLFMKNQFSAIYSWSSGQQAASVCLGSRQECRDAIAEIWCHVLNLERVDEGRSFFDLGGDSLSALQMIVAVEERLGITVPQDFFQAPVLDNLVRSVTGEEMIRDRACFVSAEAAAPLSGTPVPLDTPDRSITKLLRTKAEGLAFRLPYKLGIVWLKLLFNAPGAEHFYRMEFAAIRRYLEMLPGAPVALRPITSRTLLAWTMMQRLDIHSAITSTEVAAGLERSIYRFWREFARAANVQSLGHGSDSLIRVAGQEVLEPFLASGRCIVLLSAYDEPLLLPEIIFDRIGLTRVYRLNTVPIARKARLLQQNMTLVQIHAQVLGESLSMLRSGGAVLVVGTGRQGSAGVDISLLGKQCRLQTGFAELAIRSGAAVVPISSCMMNDGRLEVRFHPAFSTLPDGLTHRQQQEYLVGQFRAFLEEKFRDPGRISLRNILWLLRQETSAQSEI